MKVLSGIQPTGRPHWGNYFGAIRQYIELQGNEQSFYFVADLHALTTIRDAAVLRRNIQDSALDLLALGLDPEKATLFRQSDVPEVTELTWMLMTITQMHLLDKCHAYKDKKSKGINADAGLFTYPVLMAADILAYDSDVVPVGQDQVQHIEVTRDLAQRFNTFYEQDTLILPEKYVLDHSAKVPGLDGEKMSKSYGNVIPIFETPKKLKKLINKIVTDSAAMEDVKNPDTCAVFDLYKLFANDVEQEELAAKYRAGGMGYGEAKGLVHSAAMEYFGEAFERRTDLEQRPDDVEDILQQGAKVARRKAQEVVERVRSACGLKPTPVSV